MKTSTKIKKYWFSDYPASYHPSHRMINNPDQCSLVEILSVIIGGKQPIEVAERVCYRYKTLHDIAMASIYDLCEIQGVGINTALRLKGVITLGRKILEPERKGMSVTSSKIAADYFLPMLAHRDHEYFVVMILNTQNYILKIKELYEGTLDSSSVRIAEVFKEAINLNAAAIIISHNHPSGIPKPSEQDLYLTKDIAKAGKLLNIDLIDHIIVGHSDWISLKETRASLWQS